MNWSKSGAERVADIRDSAARAVTALRNGVAFHEKGLREAEKSANSRVVAHHAERIAQDRLDLGHAEAEAKTVDGLPDLDVLNRAYERLYQDRINLNDRYMSLMGQLDRHAKQARAATVREVNWRLDTFARDVVIRWIGDLTRILTAVDLLGDRANATQVARLKRIASDTRHLMSLSSERPAWVYEPPDNAGTLNLVRSVVETLTGRDNLDPTEVLRLVQAALDGDKIGEIGLPDVGIIPPRAPLPFLGEHWREQPNFCAYEPPGGARVVAYRTADEWHLDLYGPHGALLAYGTAGQDDIADLAPALTARAAEWAGVDEPAWRRFEQAAEQLRAEATT
ncbi:MAG: hypothetical protein HOV68_23720 [Streptomycetaceae bacterium]|nr:hypothetical protein [Streptomycetaceae bacterium]